MQQLLTLLFLLSHLFAYSQDIAKHPSLPNLIDLGEVSNNDENYEHFEQLKEALKDVEIVMLGEQSHGDGTTYETKIKMIKYLHEEMGFDMLVFESGLYDCTKAWEKIKNGADVPTSLGSSVFPLWSTTKQFKPLARYIDENKSSERPLIVSGFDSQFTGRISEHEFIEDLKEYVVYINPKMLQSEEWINLETSLGFVLEYEIKEYEKEQARADTAFINILISSINPTDSLGPYWAQVLKSTKYLISDLILETNYRDKQMAENLIWLKEKNPDKKIICWGATSHFLYNCSEVKLMKFPYNLFDNYYQKEDMMGQYIKDKYGDKVFTIGFIAYQGHSGFMSNKKIKPAKKNSLEFLLEKSGYDNCFLSFKNYDPGVLISRPLAHKYMENNISNVMDGVIFNKDMTISRLDRNLYLKIYPENKWISPEPVEEANSQ